MIDYEKSAELNNCSVEELKLYFEKYPKSTKKVIAVCDMKGEVRKVNFCSYRALCPKCSHIKYYKDHPEVLVEIGKKTTQFFKDNPDAREKQSEMMIEYYKDKEHLEKFLSRNIEYWSDQKHRDEQSERLTIFFKDHPEERKEVSKRNVKYHKNYPNAGKEHGKKLKDSEAHKIAIEKQRGGQDIVKHHYIYDHNDLSLYTIEMTRSRHSRLHKMMQLSGIIIPHINMEGENDTK